MTNSFGFNNVIEVIRNSSFVKTAILVTSDKVYENVEKKMDTKKQIDLQVLILIVHLKVVQK